MNHCQPFGVFLYEILALGTSVSPYVLAASTPVDDPDIFESINDAYYGLFEAAVRELSEPLGPPVFNNGQGCKGYPAGFTFDFVAVWRHAGRNKFVGVTVNETDCICSIELGVTE